MALLPKVKPESARVGIVEAHRSFRAEVTSKIVNSVTIVFGTGYTFQILPDFVNEFLRSRAGNRNHAFPVSCSKN